MQGRTIGLAVMALGVLLALTPWVIFPVCGVGRYAPAEGKIAGHHGCHATLKAETALGTALIVVGTIPVLWPRRRTVLGTSIVSLAAAGLAAFFPTVWPGVCAFPTMPCRMGTVPALIVAAILLGLAGGAGLMVARRMR